MLSAQNIALRVKQQRKSLDREMTPLRSELNRLCTNILDSAPTAKARLFPVTNGNYFSNFLTNMRLDSDKGLFHLSDRLVGGQNSVVIYKMKRAALLEERKDAPALHEQPLQPFALTDTPAVLGVNNTPRFVSQSANMALVKRPGA